MSDAVIQPWKDYEFIDSGNNRKLERFGPFILERPAPQALWAPATGPEVWGKAHAVYHRSSSGGGRWENIVHVPEEWIIDWSGLKINVKPTGFGHLGIFPEQSTFWPGIEESIRKANRRIQILNLFAYTGVATMVCLRAGAAVCHLDGSRGSVTWANENLRINHMTELPVRWIIDDVVKFTMREIKRGKKYQAVIMDPPSFGRGPKGQVWKLERDLPRLLEMVKNLLDPDPLFMLITCHSANFSVPSMRNLFNQFFEKDFQTGNIVLRPTYGKNELAAGIYGFWTSGE